MCRAMAGSPSVGIRYAASTIRLLGYRFRVGAEDLAPERLNELIEWVVAHSPVGDSISRAIPTANEIEVV